MQLKMYTTFSFLVYAHVCITIMVQFQEVMQRDCVWLIILDAELYAICSGE